MISLDHFHEEEWAKHLRTRDVRAARRIHLPVDYKFDRAPRGNKTNTVRRKQQRAPIRGIKHRRRKKVY